jgi:hypothetical protein
VRRGVVDVLILTLFLAPREVDRHREHNGGEAFCVSSVTSSCLLHFTLPHLRILASGLR